APRRASGRPAVLALLLGAAILLSSCIGLDARATVSADGSGRLKLAYRVSKMFVSLDALEGSERLLPLPLSREEFDRAALGVAGLEVLSYSRKETEDDLAVEAELAFASPAVLAAFLDPKGERASYVESGGERRLKLTLAPGAAALSPDLERLVKAAFEPYAINLAVRAPSALKSAGIGKTSRDGVEASYSSPAATLASSRSPVVWEIRW
ncbi:MAG: hypothetical protein JNG85_06280, partial [Spirochaetaceae bacterium]|nr:hypothetical protein [Spirochaetaceae bacterium]